MARNTQWILDHAPAGSKIMLWAHTMHVRRSETEVISGGKAMGTYLAERYGDSMYVLGFAYGTGRYNAIGPLGLTSHETHAPVPGSLEILLRATDMPRFVIDLRDPDAQAPGLWFRQSRLLKALGAGKERCGFLPVVAAGSYDGLIWIDQTNPSTLLPFD